MNIVFEKHGMAKAVFSEAFLTDFVPGIVMAMLFGQLSAMAYPLRAVLGDEYSPELLASQFEHLIVISIDRSSKEWKEIDPDINAETLVQGLYILKVPSLGKLTKVLQNLAIKSNDTKILTISSHSEIQMKISIESKNIEDYDKKISRLQHLYGATMKFDYILPTVGENSKCTTLPRFVALEVTVPQLLAIIRKIKKFEKEGISIEQIYDFWK